MPTDAADATVDLLIEHSAYLRALARELVRGDVESDDLVQEAYLAGLKNPLRRGGAVRGWLFRVVRGRARDALRTRQRRAVREEAGARPEAVPSAAEMVAHQEVLTRVFEAAKALPEPYRSTVHLRFYRGWGPSRIAASQGVPVATVKSRLARALDRLRERLDGLEGGRQAWCLGLLPVVGELGVAVPGSSASGVAAVVMSGKARWAVVTCLTLLVAAVAVYGGVEPVEGPELSPVAEASPSAAAAEGEIVGRPAPPGRRAVDGPGAAARRKATSNNKKGPLRFPHGRIAVHAIHVYTREPAPHATIYYLPPLAYPDHLVTPNPTSGPVFPSDDAYEGIGDLARRYGIPVPADSSGVAYVPKSPGHRQAMIIGNQGDAWGDCWLGAEPDKVNVDLWPAVRVVVKVVDHRGRPAAGVGVELRADGPTGRNLTPGRVTDGSGMASWNHLDRLRRLAKTLPKKTGLAFTHLRGADSPFLPIKGFGPQVHRLVLPDGEGCCLRIQVHDFDRHPRCGGRVGVRIQAKGRKERSHHREVRIVNGRVRLDHLPRGAKVLLSVQPNEYLRPHLGAWHSSIGRRARVTTLVMDRPEVSCVLSLRRSHVELAGRAVDGTGRPVVHTLGLATLMEDPALKGKGDDGVGWLRKRRIPFRTGSRGEFSIAIPRWLADRTDQVTLRLRPDPCDTTRDREQGVAIADTDHEAQTRWLLGELTFPAVPTWFQGRVIGESGEPLADALVVLRVGRARRGLALTRVWTDRHGRFVIHSHRRSYSRLQLNVSRWGYRNNRQPVPPAGGSGVVVQLARAGTLDVPLEFPPDMTPALALERIGLRLCGGAGRIGQPEWTEKVAAFRYPTLQAGAYTLEVYWRHAPARVLHRVAGIDVSSLQEGPTRLEPISLVGKVAMRTIRISARIDDPFFLHGVRVRIQGPLGWKTSLCPGILLGVRPGYRTRIYHLATPAGPLSFDVSQSGCYKPLLGTRDQRVIDLDLIHSTQGRKWARRMIDDSLRRLRRGR